MKYIDADKLKAEIERRLKYTHDWLRGDEKRHSNQTFVSKNYYKMKGDERTLDALLAFLSTLESEKPVPNDLEEAAMNYIAPIENDEGLDYINFNGRDIKDAFIAGAKWQAEKDARDMYMSDNRHFQKVYELGKKDMKEQMMKESVEGFIFQSEDYYPKELVARYDGELKHGDKVRIIIVKE